jgi:hypothetical protein
MGQKSTFPNFRFAIRSFQTLLVLLFTLPVAVQAQQMDVFITATNVDCGAGYAYAAVTVTGDATPPFTYMWSNGLTTQNVVLPPGTYTVTVTDANGQMASDSVVIALPPFLGVEVIAENQICGIAPDGSVTAIPFGGTPPFSYMWNTGATTAQVTGLPAGVYTVTVTDAAGCSAVGEGEILFWDEGLWLMIMPTDIPCFGGNDGMVEVSAMSGTPPYTYMWSNGDTTKKINNLGPGTYTVTVTDVNGCSAEIEGEVHEAPELTGDVSATPAGCSPATACATISISGGTPGYDILWSNGQTTATICGLNSDTYYVTVTDANGCELVDSIFVPLDTTSLDIDIEVLSCSGCIPSGSATAVVTGGSGDYTYLWSNGETGQTAVLLPQMWVYVTVTDNVSGCSGQDSVFIPSCPAIEVEIEVLTCSGCIPSGSAQGVVTTGGGNVTYLWSNGETTQVATMLPAGPISLIATDTVTGCSDTAMAVIEMCDPILLDIIITADATCMMGGEASVVVTGGTPPYTYTWSIPQMPSDSTATGLPAGTHTVTVTDATNCMATITFEVEMVDGPDVQIEIDEEANCPNNFLGTATATATGGLAPYVFLWSNGDTTATADNLPPGTHCVTVTDANGCADTACVTFIMPDIPEPSISVTADATCDEGASISVSVTGGTPPFTYAWSGGLPPNGNQTDVPPGTYTVTVTDAGMCTATAEITIAPPELPTVIIIASSNATCTDFGTATAEASGGTPGYTYEWSNGETGPMAVMLEPGTYTVTVTDDGGCTATTTVSIGFVDNGVKIGDYVWYDDDQDGFQDPSETTGVPNVTVMLMTAGPDGMFGTVDDVVFQSTTTDGDGMYMFGCVIPNDYVLMFSGIPGGYQWTGKDQVNNDCLDSDVMPNGKTNVFTITQGQADDFCFDAGIHTICVNLSAPGSICCNQTICEGDTPAPLFESAPPLGGSGTIEYLWMTLVQVGGAPPTWVGIPGATSQGYQPGPLNQTSYFMRCARREGCGPFLESNVITITVLPAGDPACGPFTNSFTADAITNHSVELEWTTFPETIQYMYTVEHSMDEVVWQELTSIMGHSDPNNMNAYEYLHQTPLKGRNYYRIKRTNPDGMSGYTESRFVDLDMNDSDAISIYPNPVADLLYVQNMTAYESDVEIDVFATNGVRINTLIIPAGSVQKMEVPMNALPAGLYLLRIRFADGNSRMVKITKF